MKILPCNINSTQYFSARKKEIRVADDIQRKTKSTFPTLSQTYIDRFYKSKMSSFENANKFFIKTNEMHKKIKIMREIAKNPEEFGIKIPEIEKNTLYAMNLNGLQQLKIGNCEENAKSTIAILFANGYYNSEQVNLMLKIDFINNETNKIEDSRLYPLDHTFVITDMNTGRKQDIIIDPWLGFADSKSGAIARFKKIYNNEDYEKAIKITSGIFCRKKELEYDEFQKKYSTKTSFVFEPAEKNITEKQKRQLGEYTQIMYNGILNNH